MADHDRDFWRCGAASPTGKSRTCSPGDALEGLRRFYGHESYKTPPVRHVNLLVSNSIDRIETIDGREKWTVPARFPWVRVLTENLGEMALHARLKSEAPMRHTALQVHPAVCRAIDSDSPPFSAEEIYTFLT